MPTRKPFFSIVIPTYNRADDLQFALFCILRQSFLDYEVIVCDNNSPDNTREVVISFKSKKIRYFRNKSNIGDKRNYKKAINFAIGEYVFLHGDDDFLFKNTALKEIYDNIFRYKPGFARVNYLCRTPDKKTIFDYVPNRVFWKNEYLLPQSKNIDIVKFVLGTDASFITGIIFKNSLPKNISILFTEPCSWIEILLYSTKRYGALFMADQQIVASWSRWRTDIDDHHVLFDVIDGKLQSERFFLVIKKLVTKEEYDIFLYQQLRKLYVDMFPAIKFFTGNNNLLQLSRRVRSLNKNVSKSPIFSVYLLLSLVTPRFVLGYIRNYFFTKFTKSTKTTIINEVSNRVQLLYKEYLPKTSSFFPDNDGGGG